jgi:hypothetical protein
MSGEVEMSDTPDIHYTTIPRKDGKCCGNCIETQGDFQGACTYAGEIGNHYCDMWSWRDCQIHNVPRLNYNLFHRPLYLCGFGMGTAGAIPLWLLLITYQREFLVASPVAAMFASLAIVGVVVMYYDLAYTMVFEK